MNIMISACLTGERCKYSGGSNRNDALMELLAGHTLIPVCPEVMGGLPTPRTPAEIRDGVVVTKDGRSADREFREGAESTLAVARQTKPELVVLMSRSPSCGVKQRYDGTFSGRLTDGAGITAALLIEAGFRVLDAEDTDGIRAALRSEPV